MQTLSQIRQLLEQADLSPQRQFGQCFLIDHNLLGKLLDLAAVGPDQTVLEVGAGTGSLTEELLSRAGRVVAVEIDRGLARLLRDQFANSPNFTLLETDVLAGKHLISPAVTQALADKVVMVSNLPYKIATPLVAECLLSSWRHLHGEDKAVLFERLTFTVQRELADRLAAGPGDQSYGPISVLVSLLGRLTPGPAVPATAFWPRPKVASRIVRIDFDSDSAGRLADVTTLRELLAEVFRQRRKQLGSAARKLTAKLDAERFAASLAKAGIDPSVRPQTLDPQKFLIMSNFLASRA